MTVSSENSKIVYDGLLGQSTFAYNFRVDEKDDMEVYIDAVLIPDGDWTITGLGEQTGGDVILNDPLAQDDSVTLLREVDLTQQVDYQPFDAFPAETHEGALDKLTFLTQQLQEQLNRTVVLPVDDDTGEPFGLGTPVSNEVVKYNAAETAFEATGIDATTFNDDVDAAAASASASAASASESVVSANESSDSAVDSSGFAVKANEWAENPEDDPVETGPDQFSAFHWAQKSEASAEFPAGTLMLFQQTNAPPGWTKEVTHDDKALRIVSGAAGSAGTSPFTTVFGLTVTDGRSITTAQLAIHNHSIQVRTDSTGGTPGVERQAQNNSSVLANRVLNTGSGSTHNHPIELRVQYVDIIIASKD